MRPINAPIYNILALLCLLERNEGILNRSNTRRGHPIRNHSPDIIQSSDLHRDDFPALLRFALPEYTNFGLRRRGGSVTRRWIGVWDDPIESGRGIG